ncbi:MAG: hypothetical protein ACRD0P_14185, partial [Stackebrandtia sp.]
MEPMLIGPLGSMIEVSSPAEMPVEVNRESVTKTLVSGQAVMYRATRSARTWTWSIPWASDDDIDNLLALEQGAWGPPPYRWYDPMAAATNMVPDVVAAAGVG